MNPWLALSIAVVFNAIANIAFKYTMISGGKSLENGDIIGFLKQPWLWVGGIASVVLLGSYLLAIKQISLSTGYAVTTTLSLVLISIVSIYLFGDKINLYKTVGITLAIIGIVMITSSEVT